MESNQATPIGVRLPSLSDDDRPSKHILEGPPLKCDADQLKSFLPLWRGLGFSQLNPMFKYEISFEEHKDSLFSFDAPIVPREKAITPSPQEKATTPQEKTVTSPLELFSGFVASVSYNRAHFFHFIPLNAYELDTYEEDGFSSSVMPKRQGTAEHKEGIGECEGGIGECEGAIYETPIAVSGWHWFVGVWVKWRFFGFGTKRPF